MSLSTRRRTLRSTAAASSSSAVPPRASPPRAALSNLEAISNLDALSSGALPSSSRKRRRESDSPEPHQVEEPQQAKDVIVVDVKNRPKRPLPPPAASPVFVKKEDQDDVPPRLDTPSRSSPVKKRARFSSPPVSSSTPPNNQGKVRDTLSSPPRKRRRLRRLGTPVPRTLAELSDRTRMGNEPRLTVPVPTPPRLWSNCIPNKEKALAERNSLNELVQQEAWKHTLCIDPLLWTKAQCRLLSCQFKHDMVAQNRFFPPNWWAAPGLSSEDACKIHVDVHDRLKTQDNKLNTLRQVLDENDFNILGDERDMPETVFVSSFRRELPFIYHDKSYAKVAADAIFTHTTGQNLAYVDLDYARSNRRLALGAAPPSFRDGQHASAFVGLKQPSPEKPRHDAEDPYIVALLIALAQKQRQDENRRPRRQRDAATQGEPRTSRLRTKSKTPKSQVNDTDICYTVTVVAVPEKAKCLYCYTATFPLKFLQKLYEPSKHTPSDWATISYFRAPMTEKIHLVQMLVPTLEKINFGRASNPPTEG